MPADQSSLDDYILGNNDDETKLDTVSEIQSPMLEPQADDKLLVKSIKRDKSNVKNGSARK